MTRPKNHLQIDNWPYGGSMGLSGLCDGDPMQYTLDGFEAPPELSTEEEKSNQQLQTKIRGILEEFKYAEGNNLAIPKTFKTRVPYEICMD